MDIDFPVYTTPNECQDCYKCVRHCISKAIRIVNSRAAVIPELCVCCGECVKVCPAHAKKIRSDLSRAKYLLQEGHPVYISLAPSWRGFFPGVTLDSLVTAFQRLGFAGVSETALGAQLVSARTAEFLAAAPDGVYLSSACPSAVDFVSKYHPEWVPSITPVVSPVIAHTRLLRQTFGSDIAVVFVGPCAAKKNEADHMSSDLNLALTFPVVESWFDDTGIVLRNTPGSSAGLVPYPAEEGRAYSLEGGMNDTLRAADPKLRYIAVSGLGNLKRLLEQSAPGELAVAGGKLFIEVLACDGGCVNGPAMPRSGSGASVLLRTLADGRGTSIGRAVPVDLRKSFQRQELPASNITPDALRDALASVGKFSPEDELNCGGCGYNTCREFARAKIEGKAEAAMCVSYLKKISQKTSNALIRTIPVGVVIADKDLQVVECNRNFAKLCGDETLQAFDTCGNLNGAFLPSLVEYTDLFDAVLAHGGELERFNQLYGKRIFNISVFAITPGQTAGAVVQDVTRSELRREQVAEKAREVIRENVLTVQKIARDLGEHMAKTEILLDEVAGTYSDHPEPAAEDNGHDQ